MRIPALLVYSRFVLGALLFVLCLSHASATWIIAVLAVAMLSDIFDGVIARGLGIATAPLRVADSWADAFFFCCVGAAAFYVAPDVLRAYWIPLLAEICIQIGSYAYDLVRYRRISSLHAYTAKIWGFSLYLAAGGILAFHWGGLIWLAFASGIASFSDALAIKLILPGWRHDVLSCFHAARERRLESKL